MKKRFINNSTLIFILSLIIISVFPLCIHILFKINVSEDAWTLALWTPAEFLNYGGTIISSIIVYFTVILTLTQNKKENEKRLQNSQLEKKYECFTQSASEILSLIPYLNGKKVYQYMTSKSNTDLMQQAKEELFDNFINLQLKINSLQLYLPVYIRFYFTEKYMPHYNKLKEIFLTIYFNFDPKDINRQFNIFINYKDEFLKLSQQYFLLLSDYYFDNEMFVKQIFNDVEKYPIDKEFKKYEIIKCN